MKNPNLTEEMVKRLMVEALESLDIEDLTTAARGVPLKRMAVLMAAELMKKARENGRTTEEAIKTMIYVGVLSLSAIRDNEREEREEAASN